MAIRIASVPSSHVYIRHLAMDQPDPRTTAVERLPDPTPLGSPTPQAWWPPRMLDPGWVREHHGEFDVMHIHFGFDAVAPAELRDLTVALDETGTPLVLTVHDLRNPHHPEPGLHDAQLSVLVEAADELITLTPGAAEEIAQRWGRTALVLPHPHVVDVELLGQPREVASEEFRVGVHLKSLRQNMAPLADIEAIVALLPDLPQVRLQVNGHTDVLDPDGQRYAPLLARRLGELSDAGLVDLRVHDYFSDAALFGYLRSLDLSVLPYAFGTHSGWLEACYDLGTLVAAPDCGYYAEQRPCYSFASGPAEQRAASLQAAVTAAARERPAHQAEPEQRLQERQFLDDTHRSIYARVLAGRRSVAS